MPQVFISYSRQDLAFVRNLAADLQVAGMEVWWDLSGIKGGDEWERKISEAIRRSQYMIVVLTPDSVESRWVRREYLRAEQMDLKIIPLKYKTCEPPLAFQDLQPIDALDGKYPACLPEILQTMGINSDSKLHFGNSKNPQHIAKPSYISLKEDRLLIGNIEFIFIPAGKFIMGSKEDNPLAFENERPQHTLELPDYWMAKFPLTNELYTTYVGKETHPVVGWEKKKNHPVVNVSWNDAMLYCHWINDLYARELHQLGLFIHLPTEAQWEKAARGEYGNEWPWGNEDDTSRCNSFEGKKRGTTPVDTYPQGDSPYGVADMVGNVWEWTHTLYEKYPYLADDGREEEKVPGSRVRRGGYFDIDHKVVRCACRADSDPGFRGGGLGFRVCASPIS
jgi:formylglycine-generating enzyme required for sulfatase activity